MAKATKQQRIRHREPMKLMSAAYEDAVRDILASDGHFHLAGHGRDDGGWAFDGLRWTRIHHVDERPTATAATRAQPAIDAFEDVAQAG
jgi:hypothetical protein